jgi:four helix bundle protein
MHERPYEKLIVWQEAYKLCLSIYKLTCTFPSEEKFALVSQMRRSAYSVPMNIAEGNTKKSAKEKMRFIEIAHASLEELHCELRLSTDLEYIKISDFESYDEAVKRTSFLLTRLSASLS